VNRKTMDKILPVNVSVVCRWLRESPQSCKL